MRAGLVGILVILVILAVVALNSLFIVNPTQQALVLQFGEVRQAIREPGLNTKIPLVQDVQFLDKRVLDLNVPAQEIIAADQKRLVVDAFMRYRIANPVRFYQSVNNVREGAQRLSTFVQSALRAVLADATFTDIVRDDRPVLMQRIGEQVSERARAIGVDVVDVKIRRADLPEANSEAIFARMQTEREQEAREIRAQGQEAARRITAAADRAATVLRAEAERESDQIRGEGDAQRAAIFAEAYNADPQFFAFFRAMQAYEQGLSSQDTRLVLSPDAAFFRYFNDPMGAAAPAAAADGQGGQGTFPALPTFDGEAPQVSGLGAAGDPADGGAAIEPDPGMADDGDPALDASARPAATPASAERAVGEPQSARTPLPTDASATDQTNTAEAGTAETAQAETAGAVRSVEGVDSEPVIKDGPPIDPTVIRDNVSASPRDVTGFTEQDIEEDVEAVIDEEMAVDEASTGAAITAAEPEPSASANAAAAGLGGAAERPAVISEVQRGNVTIVRPGQEGAGTAAAETVEVDEREGPGFAVDTDANVRVE